MRDFFFVAEAVFGIRVDGEDVIAVVVVLLQAIPACDARMVWLSRVWHWWRSAVVIVRPETVIGWHRRVFRLFWTWKEPPPSRSTDGPLLTFAP
jgi:hypothetical protein